MTIIKKLYIRAINLIKKIFGLNTLEFRKEQEEYNAKQLLKRLEASIERKEIIKTDLVDTIAKLTVSRNNLTETIKQLNSDIPFLEKKCAELKENINANKGNIDDQKTKLYKYLLDLDKKKKQLESSIDNKEKTQKRINKSNIASIDLSNSIENIKRMVEDLKFNKIMASSINLDDIDEDLINEVKVKKEKYNISSEDICSEDKRNSLLEDYLNKQD